MAEYLTKNIVYTVAGDIVKGLVNDHEEDEVQAKERAEQIFEYITGVVAKLKITTIRTAKPKAAKKSTLANKKAADTWLPFPGNPNFQYNTILKLGDAHPVADVKTRRIIGKVNDTDFYELTDVDKGRCKVLSLKV